MTQLQTRPTTTPPWRVLPTVLAVVLAVGIGLLIGPRAPELGPESTGDAALAAAARQAAGDGTGFDTLAVATGEGRTAGLGGADGDTAFELGSIAKTLTGMLLADLVEAGIVSADDTLAELLPGLTFRDPDVASITLEELGTHRSGLPRDVPRNIMNGITQQLGKDPFGELAPQDVLDAAAAAEAGPREPAYSNMGMAVLGHALAERTGIPYRDLLQQRILAPLGMTGTVVVAPGEALPGPAPHLQNGTPAQAWRGWGYAPAGGAIWSTAADLGRLLDGVVDGTAPGASAAEPRADYTDGQRIGYAWITRDFPSPTGDRTVTWHNGGTTGSRTWVAIDRTTGERSVALSSTSRDTDDVALRLLGVPRNDSGAPWFLVAFTLLLLCIAALSVAIELPPWRRRASVPRDRLHIPVGVTGTAILLWFVHLIGPWQAISPLLWTAALAAAAVGIARAVAWWPQLPTTAGNRSQRIRATVVSLAVNAVLAGVLLLATTT